MAQTNEQGGEELRKEIRKILLRSELTVTEKGSNFSAEGRLLELFEAYRKQHELEARIDEVNNMPSAYEEYAIPRAMELKAERERLGKS